MDSRQVIIDEGRWGIEKIGEDFEPGNWRGGTVESAVNAWNRKYSPDFSEAKISVWKSPLYQRFFDLDARALLPEDQVLSLNSPEDPAGIAKLWNIYNLSRDLKGNVVRTLSGQCVGEHIQVVDGNVEIQRLTNDVAYAVLRLIEGRLGPVFGGRTVIGMDWRQINHRHFLDNKSSNSSYR